MRNRVRNLVLAGALVIALLLIVVGLLVTSFSGTAPNNLLFQIRDQLGPYQRVEAPTGVRGPLFEQVVLAMDQARLDGLAVTTRDLQRYIGAADSVSTSGQQTVWRYGYSARNATGLWVIFVVDATGNVTQVGYSGGGQP